MTCVRKHRENSGSERTRRYDVPRVWSLDDVAQQGDDRAVLSHWLHNRNTKSAKPYEKRVRALLLPFGLLDSLSDSLIAAREGFQQPTFFPDVFEIPFPPPETPRFTFIDLFSGIGGIRLGFQAVGGKCVFSSEWDEFAAKTYEANFGERPFGDITKIPMRAIPEFDILLAGFPCQPFSIIGAKAGFEHETQGTLFFNIERILLDKKPKAFMLENVRNLTAHNNGKTFQVILRHLKEAGYHVYHKVLNALDYGVPQKRERIIMCGFKEPIPFTFPSPIKKQNRSKISDILEPDDVISPKLYVRKEIRESRLARLKDPGFPKPYLSHENVAGAITPHSFSCALRAGASANYLLVNDERRLSPRELLRIQGFPDAFKIVVNYGQIKRQTGNSVAVPVIRSVAESMVNALFGEALYESCECKKAIG